MKDHYLYETFSAESGSFDNSFTDYLNEKSSAHWHVKHCSYCHDTDGSKMFASCLFEKM